MGRRQLGGTAGAVALVLLLFALRFRSFLAGGVLYFRDAGFFFCPWRTLFARLLSSGFPCWNDWISCGRPFAADPNAAVFWPLTPLVLLFSPTALLLANLALLLALFVVALRALHLSPTAAAAGGTILLFSGMAQSAAVFGGIAAAAAPLPLAAVALGVPGAPTLPALGRRAALAGLALGISFLAGEPVITATGGAVCAGLVLAGASGGLVSGGAAAAGRRLLAGAGALLLALGIASVQLLPAAGELARSARGTAMRPEHGALYWSVRPGRLLTLLEPRLTGDPYAEDEQEFWGAGTFDAGNAYFYDLALGLLPLVLAAAGAADRRGRAALGLAAASALLSIGRFLPGYQPAARLLAVFRYPEKWWVVATLALSAAAAVGVDALAAPEEAPERDRSARFLRRGVALLLPAAGGLALLAAVSPRLLKALLWSAGLGVGGTPDARIAALLRAPLLLGTVTLTLAGALFSRRVLARVPARAVLVLLAPLFLADAARRVAGSCPAGPADLYGRSTSALRLVLHEIGEGRFYDDGADRPSVVLRRGREAGGFDPLHPVTGVLQGVRYAGENDIDRMTSAASVRWQAETASLEWGEEKARRLRTAGVTMVRTFAPPPDPAGLMEEGRFGGDRILRIEGTRPEFLLVPHARNVRTQGEAGARPAEPPDPLRTVVVERPDLPEGSETFGAGRVEVLERKPSRTRLRVNVGEPGGLLAIARTFDPHWHARLEDGRQISLLRADGFLSAVPVPPGDHEVSLSYENSLFLLGAMLTALSAAAVLVLILRGRRP